MSDVLIESFDVDHANGTTHTLTNDVGSTSSAFVQMLAAGSRATGAGPVGSTANVGIADGAGAVALTDTDELTFYAGTTTTRKAMGQVWRYAGSAGGANEFITRGSYALTLSSGSTSVSQAVSGIVNEDDCVPFLNGVTATSGFDYDWDMATISVRMDGSGNVVAERGGTGVEVTVYVTVVEFTGSNWTIGHAVVPSSITDSSNTTNGLSGTVTLKTGSDGTSGSDVDVFDWDTAFIVGTLGGDSSNEQGLSDVLIRYEPGTATTDVDVRFHADSGARCDFGGFVHAIRNPGIAVYRNADGNYSEGDNSYATLDWPTGAPTNVGVEYLALEWFTDTSGTGTAHARGSLGPQITSQSTARTWVHRSGNTVVINYGVIDLSGLVSASGASGTGSTSATADLNSNGAKSTSGTGSTVSANASLSSVGAKTANGTGSLSASADLASTGAKHASGTASTSVGASLSSTGVGRTPGTGSVSATATLASTGSKTTSGTAQIAAEATLTPSGTPTKAGSGTASATTSATATGVKNGAGTGTISASVTLSSTGQASTQGGGSGTISATASLTATGTKHASGSGVVSATADTAANGTKSTAGTSQIAVEATLASTGTTTKAGSGTASAEATTASTGTKHSSGTGSVSASVSLDSSGVATTQGSGRGTVTATASLDSTGIKHASGTGSVSASAATGTAGAKRSAGAGETLSATATVNAGDGVKAGVGTGSMTAEASLASSGVKRSSSGALISATAALTATGSKITSGTCSISATVTLRSRGAALVSPTMPTVGVVRVNMFGISSIRTASGARPIDTYTAGALTETYAARKEA